MFTQEFSRLASRRTKDSRRRVIQNSLTIHTCYYGMKTCLYHLPSWRPVVWHKLTKYFLSSTDWVTGGLFWIGIQIVKLQNCVIRPLICWCNQLAMTVEISFQVSINTRVKHPLDRTNTVPWQRQFSNRDGSLMSYLLYLCGVRAVKATLAIVRLWSLWYHSLCAEVTFQDFQVSIRNELPLAAIWGLMMYKFDAAAQQLCTSDTVHHSEICSTLKDCIPRHVPGFVVAHHCFVCALNSQGAFMIWSDRGQRGWGFQVLCCAVFPNAQQRWRRKPDPPLLQAACRKIWNLRNLSL